MRVWDTLNCPIVHRAIAKGVQSDCLIGLDAVSTGNVSKKAKDEEMREFSHGKTILHQNVTEN